MQVAHFLEADLKPWATALFSALFADQSEGAARRVAGGAARGQQRVAAERVAGSVWTAAQREAAWRGLDALSPLGDSVSAVFRAAKLPLLQQLPLAPAEWQPEVIGSHAVNGALELDCAATAACCDAMHAVHQVQALTLCMSPCRKVHGRGPGRRIELILSVGDQQRMCAAVAALPMLRSLTIRSCQEAGPSQDYGSLMATAIAPALSRLSRLETLIVASGNNKLGSEGIQALAPAISRLSRLASLDLSGNSSGKAGAAALASSLRHLTALTALALPNNELGSQGIQSLAPALSHLSRLASLDLSYNDIEAAGAAALASSLRTLTSLTALQLSNSVFGAVVAEFLAPSLSPLMRLQDLDLSGNCLRAAGATALAAPLGCLTALTALNLSCNAPIPIASTVYMALLMLRSHLPSAGSRASQP